MARTLREMGAAAESIIQTQLGRHLADAATYEDRIDTCRACPQAERAEGQPDTCGICGCWLRMKARDSRQTCPLGYWRV